MSTNDASIKKALNDGTSENLAFNDKRNEYSYDVLSSMDPTRMLQDSSDTELSDFFKRPIKIFEEEWGTNTVLAFDIDPWDLYFKNPRVINRIANYKLLRCKMKITIKINGNAFHYGRAIASYLPLNQFDQVSSLAALVREDLVQTSQLPHVFLNPTMSTGGSMELPFFWHQNYLDIPTIEWTQMGQLFVRSINELRHANGAADKVTVSVFAHAEDVSLSMLTSRNPLGIVPQSGHEEIDEANNKGFISGPATTIAKVSNALAVIPPIAPYALATSKVATAVAAGAKSMGYCRPTVTTDPAPFRPRPISDLAVTSVPDSAQKLTVDDKQELSIDPRIAGLGPEDPLSIKEIAKRESYLTTFTWSLGTAPESLLWNSRITPVIWAESGGTPQAFHFPACAMAAMPFRYWTGTMNFRFQVVNSAYHKGRLKFVFDPDFIASNEYNVNYIQVVDIETESDFTISISNAQNRTLLEWDRPGLVTANQIYNTALFNDKRPGNGVIGVFVVNELTVPNSTVFNDIEINVYVSMGEDFEVFAPDDFFQNFVASPDTTGVAPQSGEEAHFDRLGPLDGSFPTEVKVRNPSARTPQSSRDNLLKTIDEILEFVDGLEYWDAKPTRLSRVCEPQSGEEVTDTAAGAEAIDSEDDKPQHDNAMPLSYTMQDNALINLVFTGEAIMSFRTLLKRYNLHRRILPSDAPTSYVNVFGSRNMFPIYRGFVPGAVDDIGDGTFYNYCNTLLLHWVVLAHQGWRGSIRHKLIPHTRLGAGTRQITGYAQRYPIGDINTTYFDASDSGAYSFPTEASFDVVKDLASAGIRPDTTGVNGSVYFTSDVNPNLEFESPYYSPFRFTPGKIVNTASGNQLSEGYRFALRTESSNLTGIDFHEAVGEDFQVYFWTGLPRMYLEVAPPVPTAPP